MMAERKQTPDILSEILTSNQEQSSSPSIQPSLEQSPAKTSSPRKKSPRTVRKEPTWEYRILTFQKHKGWHVRYIDGDEVVDWMYAPSIGEMIQGVASEGWELAAVSSGQGFFSSEDKYQIFFKRLKREK